MINDIFSKLPKASSFQVTSTDIIDKKPLNLAQFSGMLGINGGKDLSPQLSWFGAPQETKSYAITVYDEDAPTGSGFWHWAVCNIPANVNTIPTGAGDDTGSGLPKGAIQLPNDGRLARFIGAAPPAGQDQHWFLIVVHALNVEDIGVPHGTTSALLGLNMASHILGRAILTATAKI